MDRLSVVCRVILFEVVSHALAFLAGFAMSPWANDAPLSRRNSDDFLSVRKLK